MATTHEVTMTLSGGSISVSVNPAAPGSVPKPKPINNDKLRFKGVGGEWSVLYKYGRTPYTTGEKTVSGNDGEMKTLKIRRLTPGERGFPVGDNVNGATFSYTIVMLDPSNQAVVALDPDIIIDDPSGGGGGTGSLKKTKKKATKKAKKAAKKK